MLSFDAQGSPWILVFAGPNGSGKSTVTRNIPLIGNYINADDIKRTFGLSDLEAAQEAEALREFHLERGLDFTFETVLSTERNLNLLRRAKSAGYQIAAIFVLTNNPDINVQRVHTRSAAGGHDVPTEKIIARYHRSLENIAELVRIADKTTIVDNTTDEPVVICQVVQQNASIFPSDLWPQDAILNLLTHTSIR